MIQVAAAVSRIRMKRIVYALGSAKERFPPPSAAAGGSIGDSWGTGGGTGESCASSGTTVSVIPHHPYSQRIDGNDPPTTNPRPWSRLPPARLAARAEV